MIENKVGKVTGHVKYVGRDSPGGKIIYQHEHNVELGEHNTVCDLYYVLMADLLAGGGDSIIAYGHAGTGSGQTAVDTNLDVPCAELRTAVDSIAQTGATNVMVVIFTLGAAVCTANLQECGLFVAQAQATADMMLYDDSLSYDKPAGGTLEVTWTITHEN